MSSGAAVRVVAIATILFSFACSAQTEVARIPSPHGASAYQRWLNEDVHWIISPEEKKEFSLLATDVARDNFIEAFWDRRDPTPGTSENEFKEEHYRRIAYANEHFADTRTGLSTDRGHAYVLFGPPDAIRNVEGFLHHTQVWVFKDRTITFVDDCDCGIYRAQGELK